MSITRSQLIACAEVDVETHDLVNVSVLAGAAIAPGRYATQSLQPKEAVELAGELLGAAAAVLDVDRGAFQTGIEYLAGVFDGKVKRA